jgi:hypothetical protein
VFSRRLFHGPGRPPGGSPAAHVAFTVARQAPGYVVSQILFQAWIYKLEVRLENGILGVRLAGVYSFALVSGCGKVKCNVESAVSLIILVIFSCLLYESRVQLCFLSQLRIVYRLYIGTCYAVAEGSKLYCVDVETCTE